MNQDELRTLVNQATFLHERRAGHWLPAAAPAAHQLSQTRLARWCQLAAGGDWDRFRQRLAWDNLTTATALPLLRDGHGADDTALPAWADLVAAAAVLSPVASAAPWPASAFVEPLVVVAQRWLAQRIGTQQTWFTAAAQQQLVDYLRQQLVALATPTLDYLESSLGSLAPTLAVICQAFPVLARHLATRANQWIDSCAEFLQRLAADWPLLAVQYGWNPVPTTAMIAALRPGLSDPHAGGRTVWAVTIAMCGRETTVAYKPKALTMDRAWNELLAWCNANGLTPQLARLWTLPRCGYGWMAWGAGDAGVVAHNTERYYQRVGMVLGLLQLLHATDCHAENLVTVGDQVLLVDAEMMRYPQIGGQEESDPLDLLRTGLLPRWFVNRAGVTEMGGISGNALSEAAIEGIAAGYQRIWHFLAQHWHELADGAGPLARFQAGEVRFGPRPTAAYLRLLDHLRQPAYLRTGVDFSIGVEQLVHSYLANPAHTPFWPLLAEEVAALAQGDVPRFTLQVGQTPCAVGQTPIAVRLQWPVLALPSAATQQQQRQLLMASLARTAYLPPAQPTSQPFLTHACQLGEILWQRALPLDDEALGWLAPQWQPRAGCYQHGLVSDDLYAGHAGIALFLAALYHVTGDPCWRDRARAALTAPDAKATCDPSGQIYVYSHCATLLGEPALGRRAARLTLPRSSAAATASQASSMAWGVLDGKAGDLLGLLSFHQQLAEWGEAQQRPRLWQMVVAYGDVLCAQQALWCDPTRNWGGFAHGAAGIAYALATLYSMCGEQRFLDAAHQGWTLQQQLYDETAGNWQDRRGSTPVYLDNWCNGAAGIGLAAAGSLAVLPALKPIVERAATRVIDAPPLSPLDTLCCGRFGQIECLLEMGILTAQPDWITHATAQARAALAQAAAAGHFQLYDDLQPQLFNPTFFRGIAGIGYTLLRLAAVHGEIAGALPCVLRWAANNTGSTLGVESRIRRSASSVGAERPAVHSTLSVERGSE